MKNIFSTACVIMVAAGIFIYIAQLFLCKNTREQDKLTAGFVAGVITAFFLLIMELVDTFAMR